MPRCFVSIGSNIDREHHIAVAVRELRRRYGRLSLSRVYESAPVGFSGEDFYNLVAGFDTEESLAQVLAGLQQIELACGRRRGRKDFAPRTLDVDLLLYGDLRRHDAQVDIPRREIAEHAFVLCPLAEIAPALVHPDTGQTLAQMWHAFDGSKQRLALVAFDFGD